MNEVGKTSEELLLLAVQPIINFIKRTQKNWDVVVKDFGRYSTGQFLKYHPYQYNTYFSPVTIEMIGVLLDLEGF